MLGAKTSVCYEARNAIALPGPDPSVCGLFCFFALLKARSEPRRIERPQGKPREVRGAQVRAKGHARSRDARAWDPEVDPVANLVTKEFPKSVLAPPAAPSKKAQALESLLSGP